MNSYQKIYYCGASKIFKIQAWPYCDENQFSNFRAWPYYGANRLGLIAVHQSTIFDRIITILCYNVVDKLSLLAVLQEYVF